MSALIGLGQLFLPLLASMFQTKQAEQANTENKQTQGEALNYADQNSAELLNQFAQMQSRALSGNNSINNQLLYGGGGPNQAGAQAAFQSGGINGLRSYLQGGGTPASGPQDLQGYAGRFQAAMDAFNKGSGDLLSGYQKREGDVMGYLKNYGDSAKAELNRQYSNQDSQIFQDAIDRGVAGSTVLPSMRIGLQRQKDDSTRALNEQISTQLGNTLSGLRGDTLGAQGNLLGQGLNLRTGLSGDFLGALDATNARTQQLQTQLGLGGINLGQTLADRKLGIMQGYPAQGPPPGNPFDAMMSGLNSYTAYQAAKNPPQQNWAGPSLTSGAFSLGSAGLLGGLLR